MADILAEVQALRATPREFDAAVAREVMGWEVHHRNTARWMLREDMGVLCHVRAKWDEKAKVRFAAALAAILRIRACEFSTVGTLHLALFGNGDTPGLLVGDYSAAALVAVRQAKGGA